MRECDKDRALQLRFWGYAIEGNVLEHDALLAEEAEAHRTRWDFTRDQLADCMVDRGSGWEPVPDWWGLRYLPIEWRERLLAGAVVA